jgi:hypothetical protein
MKIFYFIIKIQNKKRFIKISFKELMLFKNRKIYKFLYVLKKKLNFIKMKSIYKHTNKKILIKNYIKYEKSK